MYVYMITCVVNNSYISLTVNATSSNDLLCPEVAEWTCNVTGSSAHFFLSNGSINSIFFSDGKHEVLNTHYVFRNTDKGSYAIGTLIVNNEKLHNIGYPLLTCGTFGVTTRYSLALDMEGKNKYVHICLCYLSELL